MEVEICGTEKCFKSGRNMQNFSDVTHESAGVCGLVLT